MFIIITRHGSRLSRAPLCPWCLAPRHARMCQPLRAAMDPPDGPPIVIVEAPDPTPPESREVTQ